jgi:hypothetical protein
MISLLNKFKGMWHSILLFQVQRLFADSQTSLHTLYLLIIKDCPVLKQHGPTKSIMAIVFSPWI